MADSASGSDNEVDDQQTPKSEDRSSLLKLLTKAVGLDMTTIAIPVTYNEPLSFIQRMSEYLQYWELIEKANASDDPELRTLYVAAFAISVFSCSERTSKPFNPLLGETYEYVDESRDFKFIAEQVSHHPPIGASHASSPAGTFWQTQTVRTKFAAPNSLDCRPTGTFHVKLKDSGDHFYWENVNTMVHNLILGKLWVDHYGNITIQHEGTKRRAELTFKQCGWFSKGWHDVIGTVFDEHDHARCNISGKWNESIFGTILKSGSLNKKKQKALVKQAKKAGKDNKKDKKKNKGTSSPSLSDSFDDWEEEKPKLIWTHYYANRLAPGLLGEKWGLTEYSAKLIELTPELKSILPPTDSRLRSDRLALEVWDTKKAASEKHRLEEEQRERKRQREKANGEYLASYFKRVDPEKEEWEFLGNYWKEREERIKNHHSKHHS
eukprot:TRINITY_DN3761_c0_g1_i3.p1 TRINITY_DN3761_c0_g1~~TRINITY_DN3761_c0_g1_i3.p1  ORF type:complete len:437 (-),score=92.81 TRINITY_DN3761_c0_g1_i3:49-1359(-)